MQFHHNQRYITFIYVTVHSSCVFAQATEHDLHKEITKLEQSKKEVAQQLESTIFEKQKLLEKLKEMPSIIDQEKEVPFRLYVMYDLYEYRSTANVERSSI